MRRLVLTPKFRRAYRKYVGRDDALRVGIERAIEQIQDDVFDPKIGTHKLSGPLQGLWACRCGYDCRIVFAFERDLASDDELILLLDIGNHDTVY